MKTRITELFGVKYPILLSGMSWISTPAMVAAVSNAGGLGILATGYFSPEETRKAVRETRSLTDKPFGANASLILPHALESARVLLEEKVPVINFSLGKGDWIVRGAHEYGGKVVATVVNHTHAKRAQDYGCDGVIVTGHEAAAHGGDVATFVLVPGITGKISIPVIVAGGIADGRGLAAALALGAEGVAMGTRFMTTRESPLHDLSKKLALEKSIYDTVYSDRIDGMGTRVLDTQSARQAIARGFSVFSAFTSAVKITREMKLSFSKELFGVLSQGIKKSIQLAHLAAGGEAYERSMFGDFDKGILLAGQAVGLIEDLPSVDDLIKTMVAEAKDIQTRMGRQLADV